jgi:PAS domain S-box-containing protein
MGLATILGREWDLVDEIVDELPDGLSVFGTDGRMVFANRRLEELTGYTRDELIGRAVESLVPVRLRSSHVTHRTGYQGAPRPRPMGAGLKTVLLRADGTEIPIDIALSPIPGRDLVIATLRDARERLRLEARLALIDERERIARELQAGVIHAMFAVGLEIQATASIARDEQVARRLEACVAEVDTCIAELRQHVFDLRGSADAEVR